MLKKLKLFMLATFWFASGLLAQEVVFSDEFDAGDGKWNTGWVDNATASVTFAIDNTGKLSGTNSYRLTITKGGDVMYKIQRVADLPLVSGYKYTLSFMAVANKNAKINALFEIKGSPYTKYLNDTANVTTTPQTFTYSMTATVNVPDNQIKLHFGSPFNDNTIIWVDKIVVTRVVDPSFVTLWGSTVRGDGWPILNRQNTPPGDAGMGAEGPPPKWATIRGGFGRTIEATLEKAIVVTGRFEYVGEGPGASYVPLRYALTYWTDEGQLIKQYTDSARWTGTGVHYGYQFTPRSNGADMANGTGGVGTVWTVNGGVGWNSTYTNNGKPLIAVEQEPSLAEIVAGVYDFAISVKPMPDGSNEIRWYMYHVDKKYWFGGVVKDPEKVSTKFNGICFGVGDGITTKMKAFKLYGVRVELGNPITVPDAPWQPYYIQNWGKFVRFSPTAVFVPGDVVGNAGVKGKDGGQIPSNQGWTVIRGGFAKPITATTTRAVIVKGKIRFEGAGPSTWSGLRWGLFQHDNPGTLQNPNTPDAAWSGQETAAKGYLLIPHSGANELPSWAAGGAGMVGVVRNGNWISTFGNNLSLGVVYQKPTGAIFKDGTYDFAISVQPRADGKKELRFYIMRTDKSYWWGGTFIDTTWIPPTFNGVCFGLNGGNGAENNPLKGMYLEDVMVDMGNPIEIPEAPWQPYYVENWGKLVRFSSSAEFVPGDVVGNAGIRAKSGSQITTGGVWSTIRGGFLEPITATTQKAVIVTGKIRFEGGDPSTWSALRYGIFYHDSAGTLQNKGTPNATWSGRENYARGYLLTPQSGANELPSWAYGGAGHVGVVRNGNWISTFGPNLSMGPVYQKPSGAIFSKGTYKFAISVQRKTDGTKELRFYIVKEDNSYWWGGILTDTTTIAPTFNGVCFSINTSNPVTGMYLEDVQVDYGSPITVPEAPWQAYYVERWGFIGAKTGGWKLTPGDVIGNVTVGGNRKSYGWTGLSGGFFDPVDLTTKKALIVTGKMELVGGGFEGWSSLRIGLSYIPNPGRLNQTENGYEWTASESGVTGYLFVPHSGRNEMLLWGKNKAAGTVGAVVNGTWFETTDTSSYAISDIRQKPKNAVGTAGMYNFAFSVQPKTDGKTEVRFYIYKEDKSYNFGGIVYDAKSSVKRINSINFALSNLSNATKLNLYDVQVDLGNPISIPDTIVSVRDVAAEIPSDYYLAQNYPNPFNPTTTIEFGLPKSENVKLTVYDLLGRVVAELVNENLNAGTYKVKFDASNLASGIYFYTLKAGDFVTTKKLMLMK
ncbi:MAG: T9SS type A sorting domain-containing protein [Melioribacter sp.]|nr:T9SS type A sorting domain-containing protein [Melioribacter sp.]